MQQVACFFIQYLQRYGGCVLKNNFAFDRIIAFFKKFLFSKKRELGFAIC
jgi:hypothetical protein